MRNALKILVWKLEGKRPLGRLRNRWENNTKIDLEKLVLVDVNKNHLAQDRDTWRALVFMLMDLQVPQCEYGNKP
jgi:hypothetical protein